MKTKALLHGLDKQEKAELKAVLKTAEQCNYEPKHTKHVTRLALEIFEDLEDLHKLDSHERHYLLCASLLHDIGVHTEGSKSHHKTALFIILNTPILQFNQKDRLIIGSIARYHRRALPTIDHDNFKALTVEERNIVSILAGILRIADGLDYSHKRRISHVQTTFNGKKIRCQCLVRKFPVHKEIESAEKKSDLLSQTFDREIKFKFQPVEAILS